MPPGPLPPSRCSALRAGRTDEVAGSAQAPVEELAAGGACRRGHRMSAQASFCAIPNMSPQSLACCAVLLLGAALAVPAHAADTALQFGDGDFVRVPDAAALDITGPFTVEAWVKAEASITANFFKFIASKHYDGTGYTLLGAGTALQFESYSPMGRHPGRTAHREGQRCANRWHVGARGGRVERHAQSALPGRQAGSLGAEPDAARRQHPRFAHWWKHLRL